MAPEDVAIDTRLKAPVPATEIWLIGRSTLFPNNVFPTTFPSPGEIGVEGIIDAMNDEIVGAQIGGIHFEGPYINAKYKGAQNEAFIRKPNVEEVMENGAIHTLEHLFATFVRNSKFKDNIIYFGPMGCRTGFYFLTTGMTHGEALKLTQDALEFISVFEGDVPGVSAVECGNYLDHDLEGAKKEAAAQKEVLKNWTTADMIY